MEYNVNLVLTTSEIDEVLAGLSAKRKILSEIENKIYTDATNQIKLMQEAEAKAAAAAKGDDGAVVAEVEENTNKKAKKGKNK